MADGRRCDRSSPGIVGRATAAFSCNGFVSLHVDSQPRIQTNKRHVTGDVPVGEGLQDSPGADVSHQAHTAFLPHTLGRCLVLTSGFNRILDLWTH